MAAACDYAGSVRFPDLVIAAGADVLGLNEPLRAGTNVLQEF
jgi:hypothetical protein